MFVRAGQLLVLVSALALITLIFDSCNNLGASKANAERVDLTKKLAAKLEANGLWAEAVKEYDKLLNEASLSKPERARTAYRIAEIYMDKLSMPGDALPYFFTVKILDGDGELGSKADKRIVEAFEKTGRSIDAANYLADATTLKKDEGEGDVASGGESPVVAKVGDKTITLRDLDDEIQMMSPQEQEQMKVPEKKMEVLNNLIVKELILTAARRAGYDKDPQVEKAARAAREAAILATYQQKEIAPKVRITEADARAYYESHKDDFSYDGDDGKRVALPYDDVKGRVRNMAEQARLRELADETVNRLKQSEGVEIYGDVLKGK